MRAYEQLSFGSYSEEANRVADALTKYRKNSVMTSNYFYIFEAFPSHATNYFERDAKGMVSYRIYRAGVRIFNKRIKICRNKHMNQLKGV